MAKLAGSLTQGGVSRGLAAGQGITHQRRRLDVGRAGRRNLYLLASAGAGAALIYWWLFRDQRACPSATGSAGQVTYSVDQSAYVFCISIDMLRNSYTLFYLNGLYVLYEYWVNGYACLEFFVLIA